MIVFDGMDLIAIAILAAVFVICVIVIGIECIADAVKKCREKYGDDFVEMYDMLNNGIPIGNLDETQIFLAMVEAAKEE